MTRSRREREKSRRPSPMAERALRCPGDHVCDACGQLWRVDHHCRWVSALCGGHS